LHATCIHAQCAPCNVHMVHSGRGTTFLFGCNRPPPACAASLYPPPPTDSPHSAQPPTTTHMQCGTGNYMTAIVEKVGELDGCDFSQDMLDKAAAKESLAGKKLLQQDCTNLCEYVPLPLVLSLWCTCPNTPTHTKTPPTPTSSPPPSPPHLPYPDLHSGMSICPRPPTSHGLSFTENSYDGVTQP
jgi:hypothetical protein